MKQSRIFLGRVSSRFAATRARLTPLASPSRKAYSVISGVPNKTKFESNISFRSISSFRSDYEGAATERLSEGVVPKPLNAEDVTRLVELMKSPPPGACRGVNILKSLKFK